MRSAPRLLIRLTLLVAAVGLLGACEAQRGSGAGSTDPQAASVSLRFDVGAPAETSFLQGSLWNDGKGEVARYAITERRYGSLREGEATLVTVSEPFHRERLVKVEPHQEVDDPMPVMKLNTLITVPTGVYTYRQMASTFLRRRDGRPVKLVIGSQEWCGLTSKQLRFHDGHLHFEMRSYFGDEGEITGNVPAGTSLVAADALPLWVRTLDLEQPGERDIELLPPQLSNQATAPKPVPATVRVGKPERIEVPAGGFQAVPVHVRRRDAHDVYWVGVEMPHALLRWDRADGGRYELRWATRAAYWNMNDPGDGDALPPDAGAR